MCFALHQGWFCCGFALLLPVPLLLWAMLGRAERCPQCGHRNRRAARFCAQCGSQLPG